MHKRKRVSLSLSLYIYVIVTSCEWLLVEGLLHDPGGCAVPCGPARSPRDDQGTTCGWWMAGESQGRDICRKFWSSLTFIGNGSDASFVLVDTVVPCRTISKSKRSC